jgi:sugar phosphate isomerase/epimerase
MQDISLSQLTVDPVSAPDLISIAAEAGFGRVVIRLRTPPGVRPGLDGPESMPDIHEIKFRLGDTGVTVLAATSMWLTPGVQIGEAEALFDAAAELNAENVLVVVTDPDRSRAFANLTRLCELAAARELKIGLEFMPYSEVRSLPEALAFLNAAGCSNAGVVIDALHLNRSGGTPSDVAKVDHGRIAFAQLCDARRAHPPRDQLRAEARGGRLYPGQGELCIADLVRALPTGVALDVEAPAAADAALPAATKAAKAATATRAFLASMGWR